jgi:hypothetical protein
MFDLRLALKEGGHGLDRIGLELLVGVELKFHAPALRSPSSDIEARDLPSSCRRGPYPGK